MVNLNFTEEQIEYRIPVSSIKSNRTIDELPVDVVVNIVEADSFFAVEFTVSASNSDRDIGQFHFTPGKARDLASRIKDGSAEKFDATFSNDLVSELANELTDAADLASTMAINKAAGDELVNAYKEDKITAEEFVYELSRRIEKEEWLR